MQISGSCNPEFQSVFGEFERNFSERGDVGASVCVIVNGETVVDLWAGTADPRRELPWHEHSITVVMSATKAATSLCAHILADRGELDFDAPVANYWPEFAGNGKENIPVSMLLNHQAGVPALRKQIPEGGFFDWDYMTTALASERPFWEPGTAYGYHAFTFGYLVGEVVRRVDGRSLGTFFREEVAEPLDLDFWIGLPGSEMDRVAPLIPDPDSDPVYVALRDDPDGESLFNLVFGNTGGYTDPGGWNGEAAYTAEIPAAGGITNARSLAKLYVPLSMHGMHCDSQVVSPETVARMGVVQSSLTADAVVGAPYPTTPGYRNEGRAFGLPGSIIGHSGWGGHMGFADPGANLAFGYVMNRMNQLNTGDRWPNLAKAAYQALGYQEGKYGLWMR